MKRNRLGRRNFLAGAGGVTLGLPFLELLAPRRALAGSECPTRFIVMHHRQGTVPGEWKPTGGETDFQFGQMLSPCDAFRDHMLMISGVDNKVAPFNLLGDGHSSEATLFTGDVFAQNLDGGGNIRPVGQQVGFGDASRASIDQVLAGRIGDQTAFRSINLGIGNYGDQPSQIRSVDDVMFWGGSAERLTSIIDPTLTFEYLFSDPDLADPAAFARLRARQVSVLDAVQDNFAALRGRLGTVDRARLDAHAEKVRAIEMRLQNLPVCAPPSVDIPAGYDFRVDDPVSIRLQVDMLVMAMGCGLANVGTLGFIDGHGPQFPWITDPSPVVPPVPADYQGDPNVDPPPNGYTEWHDMVHRGLHQTPWDMAATEPGLLAGFRSYGEHFAYLLQALRQFPDANGSNMLDSTCVLWLSEFGNGGQHWVTDLPVVLAGNMGPEVTMGRYLDYATAQDGWGENPYSTNQLYTTILQAFGYDDQTFGRSGALSMAASDGSQMTKDLGTGPIPL